MARGGDGDARQAEDARAERQRVRGLEDDNHRMRQQLDQVRALHFTRDRWCVCCGSDWPCATIRALDAAPADETGGESDG